MNLMKKIAAGALAVLMASTMAACGGDTSWAYRSGDTTVTSGMYVGLSIDAVNAAQSLEGYDAKKNLFSQDLEGTDSVKWLKDKANTFSREYLAVEQKFAEMGLALTDEEQANFETQISSYWDYYNAVLAYEKAGYGKESFKKIMLNSTKKGKIFEALYKEGGEKAVSTEDLKTIFKNDYVKGLSITVSLKDDKNAALTGVALDDKKKEAQKLADRINAGEDFEKVKAEYTKAEAADTTVVYKKDTKELSTVGTAIVKGKIGEAKVVSDANNCYVYQVLDVMSGTTFEDYRGSVLQNLKGEEFEGVVSEWAAALSVEENSASLSKHNPKNLKSWLKDMEKTMSK